ncbi:MULTISPECIES: hypothetical protein [unclassified Streptomyces]|nr:MULTISPECIES: hypothetical protein [unclassified Streptomyces]MEE1749409.1 hypothetical protein [Streptomyces sp. JV184]MYQ85641.1 hypothetical protein [Streptomyces sp. SID4936]SCE08199.1 hypothetical protein GA0115234_1056410 [Streptomyces sp. DvalAA-43]
MNSRRPVPPPYFELRLGPLHVTVQRIPAWLITLTTTAIGSGTAWWTSR